MANKLTRAMQMPLTKPQKSVIRECSKNKSITVTDCGYVFTKTGLPAHTRVVNNLRAKYILLDQGGLFRDGRPQTLILRTASAPRLPEPGPKH